MCHKRGFDLAILSITTPFSLSTSAEWCVDPGQQPHTTQNMGKTARIIAQNGTKMARSS